MAICKQQLRDLTVILLKRVPRFYSEDAVELMLMTSAAESDGGHWLSQVGGPALSWWGVEPSTMRDNYENYLAFRTSLRNEIYDACGVYKPDTDALHYNIAFGLYMARLKYWRSSWPMPSTLEGMANFHEQVYNTTDNYPGPDQEVTLAKYKHFVL